jgi:hypothetical protein
MGELVGELSCAREPIVCCVPPVQLTVHSIGNSFKVWRDYRKFDALQHLCA